MNTYPTFQSSLPSQTDLVAIRRQARALQAEHLKAIFTVVAALFVRGDNDGIQAAAPQHS